MAKNILFVEFYTEGGSPEQIYSLTKHINTYKAKQYTIYLALAKKSREQAEIYLKDTAEVVYGVFGPSDVLDLKSHPYTVLKNYLINLYKLFKICYKHRIDLIICNHYAWSIYTNPIAFLLRIPVLIFLRDVFVLEPKIARVLMKFYSKTKYVAISRFVHKVFINKYALSSERTVTIYDGIDSELYHPLKKTEIIRKHHERQKTFVMFSRLVPTKGIEIFIDFAAYVLREHPEFKFRHYGYIKNERDEYLTTLKKRVTYYGIQKKFKFVIYEQNSNKVANILRKAYFTVMPASSAPLLNSIIKSLFCSTPVLAYCIDANTEIFPRKYYKNLVKVNSSLLYSEIIERYLKNSEEYLSTSINLSNYCQKKFASDKSYSKVMALIDQMLIAK